MREENAYSYVPMMPELMLYLDTCARTAHQIGLKSAHTRLWIVIIVSVCARDEIEIENETWNKSVVAGIVVVVIGGGVAMNFILFAIVFTIYLLWQTRQKKKIRRTKTIDERRDVSDTNRALQCLTLE